MFQSFFKPENSKSEEILEPPPLNTLLPRLIPKAIPKVSSPKIYFKEKFISKKRKKSKTKEESKPIKNTFNLQNNFNYINYFIDELQENIINHKKIHYNNSSKCYICGKPGHHGAECKEKKEEICPKCLQKNHLDEVCPNEICFNCGKRGHKQHNCFYTKKNKNKNLLKKCFNCSNYGHESYECLCKPNPIYIKNFAKIPLCVFCGSSNHYICPFNKGEGIFVVPDHYDDNYHKNKSNFKIKNEIVNRNSAESLFNYFANQKKKREKIELNLGELPEDITKEEIKNINFCCKCGDNHLSWDCDKIKNKKNSLFNFNDDFLLNIKDNNIIHHKNPLKFEPYARKEYKINHHDIRADYYDQNDSSGESFDEIFKKDEK